MDEGARVFLLMLFAFSMGTLYGYCLRAVRADREAAGHESADRGGK